jgi:hypothetical protein
MNVIRCRITIIKGEFHNHRYKKKYDSDYHRNNYDKEYISYLVIPCVLEEVQIIILLVLELKMICRILEKSESDQIHDWIL